jgi:hypothetical protein
MEFGVFLSYGQSRENVVVQKSFYDRMLDLGIAIQAAGEIAQTDNAMKQR